MNAAKKEQAQSTKNLLAASIVKKAAELEVCACVRMFVCMCACVFVCLCACMCVCVCVCVCMWVCYAWCVQVFEEDAMLYVCVCV